MTYKAIGFTNKYYTLWEIVEDSYTVGNGCKEVTTHYNYIKNISFDRETAIKQYPDLVIDESLHGHHSSWQSTKEVWDNVDVFRFGKYKYMKIAESTDTNYIAWYWDNVYSEHKDYVEEVLKSRGYEIRESTWINHNGDTIINKYLMSPEALKEEAEDKKVFNALVAKCKNNDVFEVIPEYNLDEFGEYRDGYILYHFNNFKDYYYRGYIYCLPLDEKGKSKRIKNKNIVISKYSYKIEDNNIIINVEKFEISK